jgi:hypothetical protein
VDAVLEDLVDIHYLSDEVKKKNKEISMQALVGTPVVDRMSSYKKVVDLIEFEGIMERLYKKDDAFFIFSWVDQDNVCHR